MTLRAASTKQDTPSTLYDLSGDPGLSLSPKQDQDFQHKCEGSPTLWIRDLESDQQKLKQTPDIY